MNNELLIDKYVLHAKKYNIETENALNVNNINVNPEDKQSLLKDAWYSEDEEKVIQPMVDENGIPKGLLD